MDYMIFDTAGNAVESFDSERAAVRALIAFTEADARAGEHLAVLAFDEAGEAVGDPLTVADLRPEMAVKVVIESVGYRVEDRSLTIVPRWLAGVGSPWRDAQPR